MADQREAVEMAGDVVHWNECDADHITCNRCANAMEMPDRTATTLARAVIALDEECSRKAELLADVRFYMDRSGWWHLTAPALTARIEAEATKDANRPAPSSPGASEPSGAEVEAVAIDLYTTHRSTDYRPTTNWLGLFTSESEREKRRWRTTAREAIRLGARVPR